ncbi:MAG: hypothetical protein CVU44_01720 [Chloroflexi bacterium HGW-Chloroflexi-6]|nr:MAG: hypothetical protein CVU44_01720 [Chloroflexi bacterium HGW-Chloroflexi-6]
MNYNGDEAGIRRVVQSLTEYLKLWAECGSNKNIEIEPQVMMSCDLPVFHLIQKSPAILRGIFVGN